jgi:hypothetical protein
MSAHPQASQREAALVLRACIQKAAERLAEPRIGWGYVDQRAYCPALHGLVPLRSRIVKRPLLTTVEVLAGPIRGRRRTHLGRHASMAQAADRVRQSWTAARRWRGCARPEVPPFVNHPCFVTQPVHTLLN